MCFFCVSPDSDNIIPRNLTPEVLQALRAVRFIAKHIKDADNDNEVRNSSRIYSSYIIIPYFPFSLSIERLSLKF